ncbi:MAG: BON domain-containing protein, partial [Pirellulales bacterium]
MRRFIRASAMTIAVLWPICVSAQVQDNDRIAHKVHDLLKESGQMSGSSFVIKCQDGIACLEGRVSSEEQKALALKLTGEVDEINEVIDHLRVEPSKKANPVVRLLSPLTKAAGEPQELPEESASDEEPRTRTSWFGNPAVRAAKSPQPQPADPIGSEVADETPDISSDDGSVFPEELPHSPPAEPRNLLVQQVANLRSVFKRSEPAKSTHGRVASQRAPQTAARVTGDCAACEGRAVRSSSTPRVRPVANTKRYQAASPAPGVSQSKSATAGRVRMVPMIELADGSLVPVEQARRTTA